MPGTTGKMTASAVARRGPRMRLVRVYRSGQPVGFMIERKGDFAVYELGDVRKSVIAESYALGYLLRIGKAQAA